MRKNSITLSFLLATILALVLNGCGASPSPAVTTITHTPTTVPLTPTFVPLTLTPVLPTPTITSIPKGKTIVVTSAKDSGPGTLRQALLEAKPGDVITFDPKVFPPDNPTTIFLNTTDESGDNALKIPDSGNITIDASNAGVILDGSKIPRDWANGLTIYSDGNTVQGLQIINFSGHGMVICDGSYNQIGGNRGVGTGPLGQGNLVSKNTRGIDLCGSKASFNTITGNLIGTDPTGTYELAGDNFWVKNEWGNLEGGLWIEDGPHLNVIGPDNIIATNYSYGIRISGKNAVNNTVLQNSIHDNAGDGIQLEGDANTELTSPVITDFNLENGTVDGTACANCVVELFSDNNSEGRVFEGQVITSGSGAFAFSKGAPLNGPRLTATATDARGNTSQFSRSVGVTATLQEGNNQPSSQIRAKSSAELIDNRIGSHWSCLLMIPYPEDTLDINLALGVKRFRTSINNMDSSNVDAFWDESEFFVDENYDDFITELTRNDIRVTYVLSFWDKQFQKDGGVLTFPRFQTEEQIQHYLDYVKFIVHHFKGRVHYYEIWNEPSLSSFPMQWIKVEDYINLVRLTVPVILQEDSEAKIVVGSTHSLTDQDSRDYLFQVLKSDIMAKVDVIAWHPMYGISPEYDNEMRQFYYGYPSLVQEIKDTASVHGFTGEFVADELAWYPPENVIPQDPWSGAASEIRAAKYLARGIIINLGLDVSVTQQDKGDTRRPPLVSYTIQNLSTVMAGNQTIDLPVTIHGETKYVKYYGFSLPNGDRLLALWNDGVTVENDPGFPSTLTILNLAGWKATGIDVLNGFEQELISTSENGNLVIRDFLLKDYPIIIRLSK